MVKADCYGKKIRILPVDFQIYFAAADVAKILKISNTTEMTRKLGHSCYTKILTKGQWGRLQHNTEGMLPRKWMLFLNYEGMAKLIETTSGPESRKLRRWLKQNRNSFNQLAA